MIMNENMYIQYSSVLYAYTILYEYRDGLRCDNINECAVLNGNCSHKCTDLPGATTSCSVLCSDPDLV